MWIKKKEYERLKDCERMNDELEKETKRLAELISSQTEDCKVGVWCKECNHVGYDGSKLTDFDLFIGYPYVRRRAGKVMFCKKHLHEICPEFEQNFLRRELGSE